MSLNISQTLRNKFKSQIPLEDIKDYALGRKYNLSLVFISNILSRKINKKYRGKDKPTNILSFPLSTNDGEIFINMPLVKKEAKQENQTFIKYFGMIYVHGLVHLKGFDHGSKMKNEERKIRKKFKLD
jgi:probable rRNA maturation factor